MAEAKRPSMAGRVAVVLGLFIAFHVAVIVTGVGLIAAPVLVFMLADRAPGSILFLPVLGASLLWALVPRREPFTEPGPRFDASTQPELARLVEEVAVACGQPVPPRMYLIDDVNAFVTNVGGFAGFGGEKIIAVGVPLMRILDPDELRAVIAHEFGHFHGGDVRLGPLVYRTKTAIGRTLGAVSSGGARGLLMRYYEFYLGQVTAIARRQEHAADQLSASITSPAVAAGALARLPFGSQAFLTYRDDYYIPVLERGFLPPYLAGFDELLGSELALEHLKPAAVESLGDLTNSRFDSHPPVPERVATLGGDLVPLTKRPLPERPSSELLRDLSAVERALVSNQLLVDPIGLTPLDWDDLGDKVTLWVWVESRNGMIGEWPEGFVATHLPIDEEGLEILGARVAEYTGHLLPRTDRVDVGYRLARYMLGECAAAQGLKVQDGPGRPIEFLAGGTGFQLLAAYGDLIAGRLDPDTWYSLLADAGICDGPPEAPHPFLTPPAGAGAYAGGAADRPTAPAIGALDSAADGAAGSPVEPVELTFMNGVKKHRLQLLGDRLVFDGASVRAADVTAAAAWVVGTGNLPRAEMKLWAGGQETHVKIMLASRGRHREQALAAWKELNAWLDQHVIVRLVDALEAEWRRSGEVQVGPVAVGGSGLRTDRASLPWTEIAGFEEVGSDLIIHQRADNLAGGTPWATVSLKDPNVMVLSMVATAVARSAAAGEADPG